MFAAASPLRRFTICVVTLGSLFAVPAWVGRARGPGEPPVPAVFTSEERDESSNAELASMIDRSRLRANSRNQAALTLCTAEITAVLDRQFTELAVKAEATASRVATYSNCVTLIAMLASDRVRGRSSAHNWVEQQVEAGVGSGIAECQREIQAVLDRFERELAASTITMAVDMGAMGPGRPSSIVPVGGDKLDGLSLDEALQELGFDGLFAAPALVFDAYALLRTRIVRWMITKVIGMARWLFARPLAAAVAEAGLVVADGPLPIGDVLAAVGAVWTAYDIYALRSQFETELTAATRATLPEVRQAIEQQVWTVLRERVAVHAALQDDIHAKAAHELLP